MNGIAFEFLKVAHILSATVLFGTGLGTAFHMWMAHLTRDAKVISAVARSTVRADFLFTTPAIVLQPVTGAALILVTGTEPMASWLVATYALYGVAGACWLPVIWLQIKAGRLARAAVEQGTPLSTDYDRCMRWWFYLGWPAFLAVIGIVWLMVAKPSL